MIVFDFFYFCIYSFVPNKVLLGKSDVACTLFTIWTGWFFICLFIVLSKLYNFNDFGLDSKVFIISLFILFWGGGLIFSRTRFMNPKKLKSMHRRFRKIPKWLLKTFGILYCILCFASGPFLDILLMKMGY